MNFKYQLLITSLFLYYLMSNKRKLNINKVNNQVITLFDNKIDKIIDSNSDRKIINTLDSKLDNIIDNKLAKDGTEYTIDIENLCNKYLESNNTIEYEKNDEKLSNISNDLTNWYQINRRKLPWRGDPIVSDEGTSRTIQSSAYGTWVSELMLQQTRVETVIPYWIRWMDRFPNVKALSEASSEEVNTMWAGLGYYRRAQSLLQASKEIMNEFNGIIPENTTDLLKLPGIGPYTAGAISSIAYNKHEAIVDGNVNRVLSRVFCIGHTLGTKEMDKSIWLISNDLAITSNSPSDFNQGLMELGATVCKNTQPDCSNCPISKYCLINQLVEHRNTLVSDDTNKELIDKLPAEVIIYPVKPIKSPPKVILLCVTLYLLNEKMTLMVKRKNSGLLANQWEFPTVLIVDGDLVDKWTKIDNESYCQSMSGLFKDFHITFDNIYNITNRFNMIDDPIYLSSNPIKHIFSHQVHYMYISIQYINEKSIENKIDVESNDHKWIDINTVNANHLTSGCKKILKQINKQLNIKVNNKIDKKRKLDN